MATARAAVSNLEDSSEAIVPPFGRGSQRSCEEPFEYRESGPRCKKYGDGSCDVRSVGTPSESDPGQRLRWGIGRRPTTVEPMENHGTRGSTEI